MKIRNSSAFHRNSLLRNVMIRTVILVILPVMILTFYFGARNEANTKETFDTQRKELTAQAFDSANSYLHQIQELLLSIDNDSMLTNFLTRSYSAGKNYQYYANSIKNRLAYAVHSIQGVTIRIYMTNPTIPVGFGIFYSGSALYDEPLFTDFLSDANQQEGWFLLPGNTGFAFDSLYRQYDSLFYIRKMTAFNEKPIGYITGMIPLPTLAENSGLNARSVHDLDQAAITLYYTSDQPELPLTSDLLAAGSGTYETIEYEVKKLDISDVSLVICTPRYQRTDIMLLPAMIAATILALLFTFTAHISRVLGGIQKLINQA